ncbi:DUF6090 family protein [Brumimicrobium glaciale]|nr:DUF6090 family protein [Brumimicrobium glaciale]
MLVENKIGKYLIYASGEIILVVIGILIALQINNQNETDKIHDKQDTYLSLIKSEMLNNLESIKAERNSLAKNVNSQRQLIEFMHNQLTLDTISEKVLSKVLAAVLSPTIKVDYENGILSELIASGSLKDIENLVIVNELASWEGKVSKLRDQEKGLRISWHRANIYFENHGNFRTVFDYSSFSDYVEIPKLSSFTSNKQILSSTEFENILLIQLATSMHLHKTNYPDFEEDILNLIHLIEKELFK